jgi:mannose/fructose/N-acetylgalactosamine-specific phosphotransferase system component IIB
MITFRSFQRAARRSILTIMLARGLKVRITNSSATRLVATRPNSRKLSQRKRMIIIFKNVKDASRLKNHFPQAKEYRSGEYSMNISDEHFNDVLEALNLSFLCDWECLDRF